MKLIKYQALGNDYLVYADEKEFDLNASQISIICNRRYGAGSDGILLLEKNKDNPIKLRIYNPDGSEAEKSGNGLRIFSRYLWDIGLVDEKPFEIMTLGGKVISKVLQKGHAVEVSMGKADFSCATVKMDTQESRAIDCPIVVDGREMKINAVSMGNPHCVVFAEDATAEVAKTLGPKLERHPLFLSGTNVQFVKVIDRQNISIQIWERGAGYTLSSGTSSCAAAAVCVLRNFCDNAICVHTSGGKLFIQIDHEFNVIMRGPVVRIGKIEIDLECILNFEQD